MSISSIRQFNNEWDDMLYVGQVLLIPGNPVKGQIYYVEPGDTLFLIAQEAGVSLADLCCKRYLNDLIKVGQALNIPDGAKNGVEGA